MYHLKIKTMKKRVLGQKLFLFGMISVMALTSLASIPAIGQDQNSSKTLFNHDLSVSEIWVPEIKVNSMQGEIGTLLGFYGGALINRTFLVGIAGGVNLGHPRINYGYFGGIGQIIINPENMVHMSCQLLLAYGTTKDYENPKNGLFDNFWNISGAKFFMVEPGVNLELNLSSRMTLAAGISYRSISGLNPNDENISITHVTNDDLGGMNFNVGLKLSGVKKK